MSLKFPLGHPRDEYDTPLDLQTIFKHPAGLRTARHIVRSFVRASQDNIKMDDFSSVSCPTFDSTPEVTSRLVNILSFSDTGNEALDRHNELFPLDDSFRDLQDSMRPINEPPQSILQPLPRTSPMNRSYQTMFSADGLPPPRFPLGSSTRQQPLQNASLLGDRLSFRPETPAQGTESPYRVESPSGQANGLPQGPNNTNIPTLLETDPFQLDLPSPVPPMPDQIIQSLASGMKTFSYRQMDSGSKHPQNSFNYFTANPGQQPPKEAPSIKNFLAVNKTMAGDNSSSTIMKHNWQDKPLMMEGNIVHENALTSNSYPSNDITSTTNAAAQPVDNPPSPSNNNPEILNLDTELSSIPSKRPASGELVPAKRRKTNAKSAKAKKALLLSEKRVSSRELITEDLWMRILEFTPPSFLKKVRLVCKSLKHVVDNYDSIFINQRIEMYGEDMPGPPPGLNERQYNDLLGGKGCMEPTCSDKLSSRAHWSWYKRWCTSCWESKVEREDKVIKAYQNQYGRNTVNQMLECIPAGMHDSFMKPHTYVEDGPEDNRSSSAPRIYRCYLQSEVTEIIKKYDALTPAPYKENPLHTAAEKAAALAAHQAEIQALEQKRLDFFEVEKKKNEAHMTRIRKIEECVRRRRELNGAPNQQNRNSRRELFTRRAEEDLPNIPIKFVQSSKCYKAATRIFRDGGTERGWQTLKPKIVKEWEESEAIRKDAEEAALHVASVERETSSNDYEEVLERMIPCRPPNPQLLSRDNSQNQAFMQYQMQHQMQHQMHQMFGVGSLPSSRTSSPGLYAQFGGSSSFAPPLLRDINGFPGQNRNNFRTAFNLDNNLTQMNHQSNQSGYYSHSHSAYQNQYHSHNEQQQNHNGTTIPIAFLLSGSNSNSASVEQRASSSSLQQAGPYGMFGPQH